MSGRLPDNVTIEGAVFRCGRDNGYSDSLEVMALGGGMSFSIDEPWAGDSETGFGQTATILIRYPAVRALIAWMQEWSENKP